MHTLPASPNPPPRSAALGLYLVISRAADAVAPLVLRRRLRRGKEDPQRIDERLGRPTTRRPDGPVLWLHAASVGESLSLLTLLTEIAAARPDLHILVTTGTRTSAALLADRLPPSAIHQFAPVDTARAVARFLDYWRPAAAVWTESELWPRLVVETRRRAIPMMLINARMSEQSVQRWGRARKMIAALLARFDHILTQDAATATMMRRFGVAPDRVAAVGSLKSGTAHLPCDPDALADLRAAIGERPVWLAASTHPGEEAVAARAHARLLGERPDWLLIIAPRHPERGVEVAGTLAAEGLQAPRRHAGAIPIAEAPAYVADTLGEMGLWYRLAAVAFIGGSLVPVGGHNPYEPAALGAAILTGPNVGNFATIFTRLAEGGGARTVTDADSLAAAVLRLSDREALVRQIGDARRICAEGDGATGAARRLILSNLPAPTAGGRRHAAPA